MSRRIARKIFPILFLGLAIGACATKPPPGQMTNQQDAAATNWMKALPK